jgi:hypothetical protein
LAYLNHLVAEVGAICYFISFIC